MRATTNERKKEKESTKEEEKDMEEVRASKQACKRKRKNKTASVHENSPGSRTSLPERSRPAVWKKRTVTVSTNMGKTSEQHRKHGRSVGWAFDRT